jgi:hypothetical protein
MILTAGHFVKCITMETVKYVLARGSEEGR